MEENKSTAAAEQAPATPDFSGFDKLTSDLGETPGFKSVDEMPKGEVKPVAEEKGFDKLADELEEKPATEVKADDKKEEKVADSKEEAKDDKGEDKKPDEEVKETEPELKIDEKDLTELKGDEKLVPEEESTWVGTAKELGLDVKEDSFEAFKTTFQEKLKAEREAGKAEAQDIKLDAFTPEARRVIEFLNADPKNAIDNFIEPLKVYDNVLAMNDEAIIREDLRLKNWDADKIDEKIESLKQDEKLDVEAYELRKTVENLREQAKQDIVQDAIARKQQNEQLIKETLQKEIKSVSDELDKTTTFMGFKIPESAKQHIKKQWESGEIRKAFQSNPKDVVEFMLNKYLGKLASAELKKNEFQKGRDSIQSKLHNVKETGTQGSGRNDKKPIEKGGSSFDAWDKITEEKVTVESNGF